jgi:hypothetical protein
MVAAAATEAAELAIVVEVVAAFGHPKSPGEPLGTRAVVCKTTRVGENNEQRAQIAKVEAVRSQDQEIGPWLLEGFQRTAMPQNQGGSPVPKAQEL